MTARTITKEVSRGTTEVATIVGICMALTLFAVVGLASTPTWAEMGTRLQKERGLTDLQKPSEKTSYVNVGGAQFLGPPQHETSPTDGVRFIHTDPHLHEGHGHHRDVHRHTNLADGGALMFSWTFGRP
jgi:hypothetical protein